MRIFSWKRLLYLYYCFINAEIIIFVTVNYFLYTGQPASADIHWVVRNGSDVNYFAILQAVYSDDLHSDIMWILWWNR